MSYDKQFYSNQMEGSLSSARVIIPLLLEHFAIRSAIDVGCGTGTWLSVLSDHGVTDIYGLDGEYVDRSMLQIPATAYIPCNLHLPINRNKTYDLALSLEVAEHLHPSRATSLVADLTRLSDCILFSAAIPGQYGTTHINEQWQSYWAALFALHNYIPFDAIRPKVWNNKLVEVWYRQNILLYLRQSSVIFEDFSTTGSTAYCSQIDLVHPAMYMQAHRMPAASVPGLFSWLVRRTYAKTKAACRKHCNILSAGRR